jgi:hypothetical protein
MSLMFCDKCQTNVDTDLHGGISPSLRNNDDSGVDYICDNCIEDLTPLDLQKLGFDYDTLLPLSDEAMARAKATP